MTRIKSLFLCILVLVFSSISVFADYSPTKVFLETHSYSGIEHVLNQYGANQNDKKLLAAAVDAENESFIGYNAGSNDYRLFQDLIRVVIEEKFNIQIRQDFHFLRIPGNPSLKYASADDFIKKFIPLYGEDFHDSRSDTRIHILSLNISLYQSYAQPWDLTPRYYLENQTWTHPTFWVYMREFFAEAGLETTSLMNIIDRVGALLPKNRGFLMQFFDLSEDHSFLNTHFYAAHSGGKPLDSRRPAHDLVLTPLFNRQLRLVIDNKHVLNPFQPLVIKRYDSMTTDQRQRYENALREEVRNLAIDPIKGEAFRSRLLQEWGQN